jgi:hypothetical protein
MMRLAISNIAWRPEESATIYPTRKLPIATDRHWVLVAPMLSVWLGISVENTITRMFSALAKARFYGWKSHVPVVSGCLIILSLLGAWSLPNAKITQVRSLLAIASTRPDLPIWIDPNLQPAVESYSTTFKNAPIFPLSSASSTQSWFSKPLREAPDSFVDSQIASLPSPVLLLFVHVGSVDENLFRKNMLREMGDGWRCRSLGRDVSTKLFSCERT